LRHGGGNDGRAGEQGGDEDGADRHAEMVSMAAD
jgi:hypothetical protein